MATAIVEAAPGDDLTAKQRAYLAAIEAYIDANGYPPTRRDLCRRFGFASPNATKGYDKALIRKGYLATVPRSSRNYRILRRLTGQQSAPAARVTERIDMTRRQSMVLDVIRETLDREGRSPTYREIGRAVGITSTNGISCHLKALRRKGWITYESHLAGTIRLT